MRWATRYFFALVFLTTSAFGADPTAKDIIDQLHAGVTAEFERCSFDYTLRTQRDGRPDEQLQSGTIKISPEGTRVSLVRTVQQVTPESKSIGTVSQEYLLKKDSFTERPSLTNPAVCYLYNNGVKPEKAISVIKNMLAYVPYDLHAIVAGNGRYGMRFDEMPLTWELTSTNPEEVLLTAYHIDDRRKERECRLDPRLGFQVRQYIRYHKDPKSGAETVRVSTMEYFENSRRIKRLEMPAPSENDTRMIWEFSNWSAAGPTDTELDIPSIMTPQQSTVFFVDDSDRTSVFKVVDGQLVPDDDIEISHAPVRTRPQTQPATAADPLAFQVTSNRAIIWFIVGSAVAVALILLALFRRK